MGLFDINYKLNVARHIQRLARDLENASIIQTMAEHEIRKLLILSLYAQICQLKENHVCNSPECIEMKMVLEHMSQCTLGKYCQDPFCSYFKHFYEKIHRHWRSCDLDRCSICDPFSRFFDVIHNGEMICATAFAPYS